MGGTLLEDGGPREESAARHIRHIDTAERAPRIKRSAESDIQSNASAQRRLNGLDGGVRTGRYREFCTAGTDGRAPATPDPTEADFARDDTASSIEDPVA